MTDIKIGDCFELIKELPDNSIDLDGNYIADYKNRLEASKATGVQDGDIMRTYNRTKFNSRGGFIWKLEKNNYGKE